MEEASELAKKIWYRRHFYIHTSSPSSAVTQPEQSPSSTPTTAQDQAKQKKKKTPQMTGKDMKAHIDTISMELFDFDCNLTHPDLMDDVMALMDNAAKVGVTEMLVPGATITESQAAIALCRQYPTKLFPTAGVHPYHALSYPTDEERTILRALAQDDQVRAVGECGLDYSPGFPDGKLQLQWFESQLELACTLQKPLFLHERLAHDDFISAITNCKRQFNGYFPPAVVHCFTGNQEELQTYIANDFYIGVTGFICKTNLPTAKALRSMLHLVPLNRLVIETDAPYMGFSKCRRLEPKNPKKQYPNVPSALPQVLEVVAQTLSKSPQEIAQLTKANARRFLRLSV